MAAYVCPQTMVPVQEMVMGDMPCAGMDIEKPVHCAEQQSGTKLALEHLAAVPSLAPTIVSFIMPASLPIIPVILASAWTCLLYTSPSPRDKRQSRMPSSA